MNVVRGKLTALDQEIGVSEITPYTDITIGIAGEFQGWVSIFVKDTNDEWDIWQSHFSPSICSMSRLPIKEVMVRCRAYTSGEIDISIITYTLDNNLIEIGI